MHQPSLIKYGAVLWERRQILPPGQPKPNPIDQQWAARIEGEDDRNLRRYMSYSVKKLLGITGKQIEIIAWV